MGIDGGPSGPAERKTADLLAPVRSTVRRAHFPPTTIPVGEPISGVAYAESWLACRYIAERYSETRLGRLYSALDRGRSLDEASRSVLKISETELIGGWRAYRQLAQMRSQCRRP